MFWPPPMLQENAWKQMSYSFRQINNSIFICQFRRSLIISALSFSSHYMLVVARDVRRTTQCLSKYHTWLHTSRCKILKVGYHSFILHYCEIRWWRHSRYRKMIWAEVQLCHMQTLSYKHRRIFHKSHTIYFRPYNKYTFLFTQREKNIYVDFTGCFLRQQQRVTEAW